MENQAEKQPEKQKEIQPETQPAAQSRTPFWQALGMGALAGLRSMAAPAVASHYLNKGPDESELEGTSLNALQQPEVASVLKLLAAGEMLGDKAPGAPDRIDSTSLFTRGVSGAVVGATLYKSAGEHPVKGALLGSTAAVVATYASFYFRKELRKAGVLDTVVGLVEDLFVVQTGAAIMEQHEAMKEDGGLSPMRVYKAVKPDKKKKKKKDKDKKLRDF